jgi:TolA-binding protein
MNPSPARADAGTDAYQAAKSIFQGGNYDDALAAFAQVKANFPSAAADAQRMIGCCYQWKGDYDRAIAEYRLLFTQYPNSSAAGESHFWVGCCLESKSADDAAIAEFEEQLRAGSSRRAETHMKLATRYRSKGDSRREAEHFSALRALADGGSDPAELKRANLLIGAYLRQCGRWDEARQHYQKIMPRYPEEDQDIRFQLAESQFSSKCCSEAASTYQSFADKYPSHPRVNYSLLRVAECYRDMKQIDVELAYLDLIAAEHPELKTDAGVRRAEILSDFSKEYAAAEELCKSLMADAQSAPQIFLAKYRLAYIYAHRKFDYVQARPLLNELLRDYPDSNMAIEIACDLAACSYYELNYKEAAALYEEAATKYAAPVVAWKAHAKYMAGVCYLSMGSTAEARAAFTEVVDKYPGNDWSKAAAEKLAAMETVR